MNDQERIDLLDWFIMDGREATGILWRAAGHVRKHDVVAALRLLELRDELILSADEDNKTVFNYRKHGRGRTGE